VTQAGIQMEDTVLN